MNRFLVVILLSFSFSVSFAQDWMTNLDIAERLALAQNKLLVVVWQDAYYKGAPAYVKDTNGKDVFIKNMFLEPVIDSLLWEHFIPVILNEDNYSKIYKRIKGKRSANYIDKFNDDSLKIMDANGNILNSSESKLILNISEFIFKYSLNMSFFNSSLENYKREQDFYSAFYLSDKYMDFTFYSKSNIQPELVYLASIYLDEAIELLSLENLKNKSVLEQRVRLLEIQKDLLFKNPKKALKKLNKIKTSEVAKVNTGLRSFLYFTSYKMLQDENNASLWESKVSTWDKNKLMHFIINL